MKNEKLVQVRKKSVDFCVSQKLSTLFCVSDEEFCKADVLSVFIISDTEEMEEF